MNSQASGNGTLITIHTHTHTHTHPNTHRYIRNFNKHLAAELRVQADNYSKNSLPFMEPNNALLH